MEPHIAGHLLQQCSLLHTTLLFSYWVNKFGNYNKVLWVNRHDFDINGSCLFQFARIAYRLRTEREHSSFKKQWLMKEKEEKNIKYQDFDYRNCLQNSAI